MVVYLRIDGLDVSDVDDRLGEVANVVHDEFYDDHGESLDGVIPVRNPERDPRLHDEDDVVLDRDHAETLLEAAGTLRDDLASGRDWGTDDPGHQANARDLKNAYEALQADLREHDAVPDGGNGGTWHVVCHDCPFEEVVDDTNAPTGSPERDSDSAWTTHLQETDHDVSRARIDTETQRQTNDRTSPESRVAGRRGQLVFLLAMITISLFGALILAELFLEAGVAVVLANLLLLVLVLKMVVFEVVL